MATQPMHTPPKHYDSVRFRTPNLTARHSSALPPFHVYQPSAAKVLETDRAKGVKTMEVEYGLKIDGPAQDLAFDSVETDSAFVLRIRVPGEEMEGIQIEVDEDGTALRVLARRARLPRKEAAGRFRKVFRVPEGVETQRIEAKYDEDDEILAVYLPKLVAGPAVGTRIEEITTEEEEEEEEERGAAKGIPWREPEEAHRGEETPVPVEMPEAAPGSPEPVAIAEEEPDRSGEGEEESGAPSGVEVLVDEMEKGGGGEEVEPPGRSEGGDGEVETSGRRRRKRSRAFPFCTPLILAGSAFLCVAVALVSHVLAGRSKKRRPQRRAPTRPHVNDRHHTHLTLS